MKPRHLALALLAVSACASSSGRAPEEVAVPEPPVARADVIVVPPAARRVASNDAGDADRADACIAELRDASSVSSDADASEPLYRTARAAEARGRLDEARKAYFRIIQDGKSPLVPYSYLAFGILFEADAASDPSKLSFARQSYEEVLKHDDKPASLAAQFLLSRVHRAMKNDAESLHALSSVLTVVAQDSRITCAADIGAAARRDLVDVYAAYGDPTKALSFFRRLAGGDAGAGVMVGRLARALASRGSDTDAKRIVTDALRVPTAVSPSLCAAGRSLPNDPSKAVDKELSDAMLAVCGR